MKFSGLLFLSLVTSASAFSAVLPKAANIDRSMNDVDDASQKFDPTEGEASALKRNNKDEVWVQQVRFILIGTDCILTLYFP